MSQEFVIDLKGSGLSDSGGARGNAGRSLLIARNFWCSRSKTLALRPDMVRADAQLPDVSEGHADRDVWAFGAAGNALGETCFLTSHGPADENGILAQTFETTCTVDASGLVTTSEPCVVATVAPGCWAKIGGRDWTEITDVYDAFRFRVANQPPPGQYPLILRQSYPKRQARVPASVGMVGNWAIVSSCDPVLAAGGHERFGPLISNLEPGASGSRPEVDVSGYRFLGIACVDEGKGRKNVAYALDESGRLLYSIGGLAFLEPDVSQSLGDGWQKITSHRHCLLLAKPGMVAVSGTGGRTFATVELPSRSSPRFVSASIAGSMVSAFVLTVRGELIKIEGNTSPYELTASFVFTGPTIVESPDGGPPRLVSGVVDDITPIGLDRFGNVYCKFGYVSWISEASAKPVSGYREVTVSEMEIGGRRVTSLMVPYFYGEAEWSWPMAKASLYIKENFETIARDWQAPIRQRLTSSVTETSPTGCVVYGNFSARVTESTPPITPPGARIALHGGDEVWLPDFVSVIDGGSWGLTKDGYFVAQDQVMPRFYAQPTGRSTDVNKYFVLFGNLPVPRHESFRQSVRRLPTAKKCTSVAVVYSPIRFVAFTTDDGKLYLGDGTEVAVPGGKRVNCVASFGWANILAVGEGGLIIRTLDGGQTWEEIDSGTTNDLLWCSTSSVVDTYFVCGKGGTLLAVESGVVNTINTGVSVDLLRVVPGQWTQELVVVGESNTALYFPNKSSPPINVAHPSPPSTQTKYCDADITDDLSSKCLVYGDGLVAKYDASSGTVTDVVIPFQRLGCVLGHKTALYTETGVLNLLLPYGTMYRSHWNMVSGCSAPAEGVTVSCGSGRMIVTPLGAALVVGSSVFPMSNVAVGGALGCGMAGPRGMILFRDVGLVATLDEGATWFAAPIQLSGQPVGCAAGDTYVVAFDSNGNGVALDASGFSAVAAPFGVKCVTAGEGIVWVFSPDGRAAWTNGPPYAWNEVQQCPGTVIAAASFGTRAAALVEPSGGQRTVVRFSDDLWEAKPVPFSERLVGGAGSVFAVNAAGDAVIDVYSDTAVRVVVPGAFDVVGSASGLVFLTDAGCAVVSRVAAQRAAGASPFRAISPSFGSNVFATVDGYLVLFGVVELSPAGREYHKRRIRWSVPLDPNDFEMPEYSGIAELPGGGDFIAAAPCGHSIIAFDTDGVCVLDATGDPTAPWSYRRIGDGVVTVSNPVSIGNQVLFVSVDGRLMVASPSGIGEANLDVDLKPLVRKATSAGHGVALSFIEEAGALFVGSFDSDEWYVLDIATFRATTWRFKQRPDCTKGYPSVFFSIPGRDWFAASFGAALDGSGLAIGAFYRHGVSSGRDVITNSVGWHGEIVTSEVEPAGAGVQISIHKMAAGGRFGGVAPVIAAGVIPPTADYKNPRYVIDGGVGGGFVVAAQGFTAPNGKPISNIVGYGDGVRTTFPTPVPAYRCVVFAGGVQVNAAMVGDYLIEIVPPPPDGAQIVCVWLSPPSLRVKAGDLLEDPDGDAVARILSITDAWSGTLAPGLEDGEAIHRPARQLGSGSWIGVGAARTLYRPKLRFLVVPDQGTEWAEIDWLAMVFGAPGGSRWVQQ